MNEWDEWDIPDFDENATIEPKTFDLVAICNEIVMFESQLAEMRKVKAMLDNAKADLKEAMEKAGIKRWETPNGYKVTLVADTPDKTFEEEFVDTDSMRENDPDVYLKYLKTRTVTKNGRSGYVRISAPKGGVSDV